MDHPSQLPDRRRALSLLAEFFSSQSERRSTATHERYLRVHQHQLVICLPRFVEPPWLMSPAADARAQIALAARLIKWLDTSGLLALDACSFLDASAAVKGAQQRRGQSSPPPRAESRARLTLLRGGLADR